MRILIIDNLLQNLADAENQLQGHELVIASTYDEAQKALTPQLDHERCEQRSEKLLAETGFPDDIESYRDTDRWDAYLDARSAAYKKAREELTVHPRFDAVLTDLMMPPSRQALAEPYKFVGQEMPLGTFLVLLAMRAGVKKVGLVTDTNHHHHPASAAIDVFQCGRRGPFIVGDTSIVCWNYGKNWRKVFGLLNGEDSE